MSALRGFGPAQPEGPAGTGQDRLSGRLGPGGDVSPGQSALHRLASLQGDGHGDAGLPGWSPGRRRCGQPIVLLAAGGPEPFRDKRIPRENLNGLVVTKTGMAAVLYTLTGIGGPWAQDPPYYGEVVAFETGAEMDWAHIRLTGWRGWQQDRWIYFYHNGGPVVVADEARGPKGDGGAVVIWHLASGEEVEAHRYRLDGDGGSAEVLLLPLDDGGRTEALERAGGSSGLDVAYSGTSALRVATVFLVRPWVGAEVGMEEEGVRIAREGQVILAPLAEVTQR